MKKKNIGSSFDEFLHEDETYEEVTRAAVKRVLSRQLEAAMAEKELSKTEMARRMNTSRAALNRLLDPENEAVTLETLQRAAEAVGREVRLELI
jgi:DNA-binding Xre family transcriptional regulator